MNGIINRLKKLIHKLDKRSVLMRPPRGDLGHISTNVAHLAGKENIIDEIREIDGVVEVHKAGNFLNIIIDHRYVHINIPNYSHRKAVSFEYCSANPTGPLHMGHSRVIANGVSLVNLCQLLQQPHYTEFYLNDLGKQVDQFRASVQAVREGRKPEVYKGEHLKELANSNLDPVELQFQKTQSTLGLFGSTFDCISRESDQTSLMPFIINHLDKQGVIFRGNIPNQKQPGELVAYRDVESNYHALQLENGKFTYFALDIAYAINKQKRGHNDQLCLLGEDHKGHVKRMTSVLKYFSINYQAKSSGIIKLRRNKQLMTMSKRSGNFIRLDHMLKSIPASHIICAMLEKGLQKSITIDIDQLNNNSKVTEILLVSHRIDELIKLKLFSNKIKYVPELNKVISYLLLFESMLEVALLKWDAHYLFDNFYKFIKAVSRLFNLYSIDQLIDIMPASILEQINFLINTYKKIFILQ